MKDFQIFSKFKAKIDSLTCFRQRKLAELFMIYGVPQRIRCDNGPEFISLAIKQWLEQIGITVLYIEPGSPWQNGLCESFNGRFRDEFIQQSVLLKESDARRKLGKRTTMKFGRTARWAI